MRGFWLAAVLVMGCVGGQDGDEPTPWDGMEPEPVCAPNPHPGYVFEPEWQCPVTSEEDPPAIWWACEEIHAPAGETERVYCFYQVCRCAWDYPVQGLRTYCDEDTYRQHNGPCDEVDLTRPDDGAV